MFTSFTMFTSFAQNSKFLSIFMSLNINEGSLDMDSNCSSLKSSEKDLMCFTFVNLQIWRHSRTGYICGNDPWWLRKPRMTAPVAQSTISSTFQPFLVSPPNVIFVTDITFSTLSSKSTRHQTNWPQTPDIRHQTNWHQTPDTHSDKPKCIFF